MSPAFEAKSVARLLSGDRVFMEVYKKAAREDRIKAVSFGGRNYVVVLDPDIVREIQSLAPQAARYHYDDASGRVDPAR